MESVLTRRCGSCGYRYEAAMEFCPHDRRHLPPPDDDVANLGAYRLVQRLADGGMGAVYRAVHRRLGRVVAIKLLQRDLAWDRGIINRFFHEARAANTIRHEHVIEVYDFVESGEDVYFVMEYLKGQDLHDTIHAPARGGAALLPLEPARAVSIVEQIASALHATHARNIVHRDLKPENVFLAEKDGTRDFVKVFDFGVAKLDRPDGRSTVEGAVLGTPEYMAPEQARGAPVDARADLYSLGCIAYEMLTRRQAFGGGTQAQVLVRQITWTPPSPREVVPELPAALDEAVMRALAKDPAQRPQTAMELAEEMARALGRGLQRVTSFRTASGGTPPPIRSKSPVNLVLREPQRPDRVWRSIAVAAASATLLAGVVVTAKLRRGWAGAAEGARAPTAAAASASSAAAAPSSVAPPGTPVATILLQSMPDGADILDEQGRRLGVTPQDLVLPLGSERLVRFQKAGFRAVDRRFQARGDTTIAVRLDPEEPARARAGTTHPGGAGAAGSAGGKGRSSTPALDSVVGTIDPFAR